MHTTFIKYVVSDYLYHQSDASIFSESSYRKNLSLLSYRTFMYSKAFNDAERSGKNIVSRTRARAVRAGPEKSGLRNR